MINYEIQADLHPKKLTGIAIKKTQGVLFMTDILPERSFPEFSGYYKKYNEVAYGHLAPEVGEGGEDTLLNTSYSEHSFTMKEYRIGGRLTERAINFLLSKNSTTHVSAGRQLVTDEIEFLAETLALREEKAIMDAVVDGADSENAVAASANWSSASSTPVADLRTACKNILDNQHTQPDTLIISPQVELDLMNHADVKDIYKYSGKVTNIEAPVVAGVSRSIPNIAGLDVYVSDAVYGTLIPSDSATTALRPDSNAIVCKRGPSLGLTYVAEPLTSRRWEEPGTRSIRVQLFKTFVPVVFRDSQIAIISNV
jgi:hypothetical protein